MGSFALQRLKDHDGRPDNSNIHSYNGFLRASAIESTQIIREWQVMFHYRGLLRALAIESAENASVSTVYCIVTLTPLAYRRLIEAEPHATTIMYNNI
jgi:hypothetical protein